MARRSPKMERRESPPRGCDFFLSRALGRRSHLSQLTDPKAGPTAFSYGPDGNLLSVTDPRGGVTRYAYDNRNRRTSRTDPLGRAESYSYDALGNLTGLTDRRGKLAGFSYDGLGRRTFAGFGASAGQPTTYESTVSYTWDGGNRLTQAADSIAGAITRALSCHGVPWFHEGKW